MKSVTFLYLVSAVSWMKSENLSATTNNATNEMEDRVPYDGYQLWNIYDFNNEKIRILEKLEHQKYISIWDDLKTSFDILVKPNSLRKVMKTLTENHIKYKVMIEDVQKAINEQNPVGTKPKTETVSGHRLTWQAYHRLDVIYEYLDYIGKNYPNVCTVQTIGFSFEKRPIKLLKISNGNITNEAIWVDGGIHSREWVSPATVTFIINQFAANFSSQPAAVRNVDWYIIPVLNPDGYEFTHTHDRNWRKNRRSSSRGKHCFGVDLNRNFGYKWGGKGSAARDPCADSRQTYRGSRPFSEPESLAVKNFIENSTAKWRGFVTFHSYSQFIVYPWGYDNMLPSDHHDLQDVALSMASAIRSSGGPRYKAGSVFTLLHYRSPGNSIDWAKGSVKIRYSYAIELRDRGKYGFFLPASKILPTAVDGLAALTVLAEALVC